MSHLPFRVRFHVLTVPLALFSMTLAAGCTQPAARAPTAARPAQTACLADEIPPAATQDSRLRDACQADITMCDARCNAGNARACLELAYALEQGDDAQQKSAIRYYSHACHLGELNACTNYAAAQRIGKWLPPDTACATRVFERTCSGGEPWGCGMYGQALLNGEGTAVDSERALRILRIACEQAPGFACAFLAVAHEEGRFGAPDRERAQELYRRACGAGVSSACTHVEAATPTTTL